MTTRARSSGTACAGRRSRSCCPTGRPFELVDVGAGAGLLGEYLLRDFPQARYRFVEPIESLEQLLVERFGADANARDETTYTGAEFVTLLDVLEHQPDDLEFMTDVVGRLAARRDAASSRCRR